MESSLSLLSASSEAVSRSFFASASKEREAGSLDFDKVFMTSLVWPRPICARYLKVCATGLLVLDRFEVSKSNTDW